MSSKAPHAHLLVILVDKVTSPEQMVCVSSWVLLHGFPHFLRDGTLARTVVASVASLRRPHLEIGHHVYELLVSGSSLFAVWLYSSWRNAWFNNGYMLRVGFWYF